MKTLRWFAASVVIFLATSVTGRQPGAAALAITHVNVIDTAAGMALPDLTVVVRGDRIISVEKNGVAPAGAQIVDGRGKFLIPGLWDMHVHLSYARESALPVFAATGVTYVRDVGSDLAEIDRWKALIEARAIAGPFIFRAGPTLNGQESSPYLLLIANAADARMAARTLKKAGVDLFKTHRRTSREAYFALADEAKKLGILLTGHVPITVSPAEASDAGQQIEHIETLFEGTFAAAHNGRVLAGDMEEWRKSTEANELFAKFVRNGTVIDPTLIATGYLAAQASASTPDPQLRFVAKSALAMRAESLSGPAGAQLAQLAPMVKERQAVTLLLQRAGVTLITGTDTSFFHPPAFSLHEELEMLAAAGLTPAEVLRAASVNCARLFPAAEAGTIAPGKRADLVLLDANPLVDIRNTQRIQAVVLRGALFNRTALDRLLKDAAALAAKS